MFVYEISPIDSWFGWMKLEKVLELIGDSEEAFDVPSRDQIQNRFCVAKALARQLYWEGDFREGPYFIPLPWETGMYEFLIAWKQDNNGTTYVASPVQLPWLHIPGNRMAHAEAEAKITDFSH